MENLDQSFSEREKTRNLSKIEQTLARSRKAIKQSIQLTRKSSPKRVNFQIIQPKYSDELQESKENEQPYDCSSGDITRWDKTYYQEKIQDLKRQLERQKLIKQGYEKELKEIKQKVLIIQQKEERKEIIQLKAQLKQLAEQNQQLSSKQIDLHAKIQQIQQENAQLNQKLNKQKLFMENNQLINEKQQLKTKVQQFKQQAYILKTKLQQIQFQHSFSEGKNNQLLSLQINDLQFQLNQNLRAKLQIIDNQIQDQKNTLKAYQTQILQLKSKIDYQSQQNKKLQDQIRYMYQNQSIPPYTPFSSFIKQNTQKIRQLQKQLNLTTKKHAQINLQLPVSKKSLKLPPKRKTRSRDYQKTPKIHNQISLKSLKKNTLKKTIRTPRTSPSTLKRKNYHK